jgi:glycerate-2-kinase
MAKRLQKIANRNVLQTKNKNSISLRFALAALEDAIRSVDPHRLVNDHVKVKNDNLLVSDIYGKCVTINLSNIRHTYVIGAGKASGKMALAITKILGQRVSRGAINVPYNSDLNSDIISFKEAGHPLPDQNGVIGTKKILNLLSRTSKSDVVIALISGGGSALLPMPRDGISLSEKQQITQLLLLSGASINEVNVVRKHLSAVKGGQLLKWIRPGCLVISLIISDVIGDDFSIIASGPTFPDGSTFVQAKEILEKYMIWDSNKEGIIAVRKTIEKGINGIIRETVKPGDNSISNVRNFIIGNNETACKAAVNRLKKMKVNTIYLGSSFGGLAVDHGRYLAHLAYQFSANCLPSAFVLGGETVVKLEEIYKNSTGGRNQEAVLSSGIVFKHKKNEDVSICCLGTDGIDGNSKNAGAIITSRIFPLISSNRKMYEGFLIRHDSSNALRDLDSLITTGRTGTNVNDISMVIRAK